jgi:acylphosphatase
VVPVHHVRVTGRVQGVGFRWFVRERAHQLGLAGWIRNRPDGSVELVVSGDDPAAEQLLAEVRRGPPHARVEQIEHLTPPATTPPAEPLPRPFAVVRE